MPNPTRARRGLRPRSAADCGPARSGAKAARSARALVAAEGRAGQGGRFACAVAAAILLAGAMGGCKERGLGFGEGNDASFAALDGRGRAGRPLSVVFFGGSLTWGAGASDPQRTSYRALTSAYRSRRSPSTTLPSGGPARSWACSGWTATSWPTGRIWSSSTSPPPTTCPARTRRRWRPTRRCSAR